VDETSDRSLRQAPTFTEMGRYILGEWTNEYREGRLSRREFLRRVGVFAGGAALAGSVLAAVGVEASPHELMAAATAPPPGRITAAVPVVPLDDPAVRAQMIMYPTAAVSVIGYLALPADKPAAPGIVVVHENRGLLDHHMDVARRLAKAGYAALAPDLASPIGGTAKYQDLAQVAAFLGKAPVGQLVGMLDAGVRYLQSLPAVRRDRLGAVGFCFGGGLTWRLAMQNADLKAVVPFYGPNPPSLDGVANIRAAVLAFYGALDTYVDPGIPAMRAALEQAHVTFEMVVEPNAGHAFFNDTSASYNAAAAADAWPRALAWFGRYLGT